MTPSLTPSERAKALLTLAERCEQAEGQSRELDNLIGEAIGATGEPFGGPVNRHPFSLEMQSRPGARISPCGRHVEGVSHKRYTASLDAAMTLVPEGCVWLVRQSTGSDAITNGKPLGVGFANVHPEDDVWSRGGSRVQWTVWAATPALALCAAALRARASQVQS